MSFAGGYQPSRGGSSASQGPATAEDEFPLLCETCLGPNPYVRMIKLPFGSKLCKIAKVPFQVFRWKAGPSGRYKETIVSAAIAKQKNICQVCLNDLQYGVPVGVRDAMLTSSNAVVPQMPMSEIGQLYAAQQTHETPVPDVTIDNIAKSHQLTGLSQRMYNNNSTSSTTTKTAFRNLPKLCSFWVQGTCQRVNRGVCPFRPCCGVNLYPELASSAPDMNTALIELVAEKGAKDAQKHIPKDIRIALKGAGKGSRDESIRKRVAGQDELTNKYMNRLKETTAPPPDDINNTTLWLGNIPSQLTEQDVFDSFYAFGSIRSVHIVPNKCAFVEFVNRSDAETAITQLQHGLVLHNNRIHMNWSKPRQGAVAAAASVVIDDDILLPPPPTDYTAQSTEDAIPSGKRQRIFYPAMDPTRLGSNY